MRKAHARFKFVNTDRKLLQSGFADLYVEIDRRFRIEPLSGMKQPTPHGAFLGSEVFAKVTYKSKPARSFRWALKCNNRIIQTGLTDIYGMVGDMEIDLPDGQAYEFAVYAPKGGLPRG